MPTARAFLLCAGVFAAVALCASPASPVARAAEDAALVELQGARDEVIRKLLVLDKECRAKRCVKEAREACERVIGLDPDNADARKALGHEKKSGRWWPPSGLKVADSPAALAAEFRAKRAAIVAPFVARSLEIAARADASIEAREIAATGAVAAEPDSEAARAANGEVRDGDTWRLRETMAARARRTELAALWETKRKATTPPTLEPSPESETATLGAGARGTRSEFGRVAGSATNADDEIIAIAWDQPALEATYRAAVGTPRALGRLQLLLFPDQESGIAAVSRDKRFSEDAKRFASGLYAAWAPGTLDYFCYGKDPPDRREQSLRAAVGTWLYRTYGVDARRGWALEGGNHWFSEVCLGTHRCAYVKPSPYATDQSLVSLTEKLRSENANWLALVADLGQTDAWPGVRAILPRDVNSLGPEGVLVGYLFSRYLIEARPDAVASVMAAAGLNEGAPDIWFAEHLQATPEGIDRRLRRFAVETISVQAKSGPPPAGPPAAPPVGPKPPPPKK